MFPYSLVNQFLENYADLFRIVNVFGAKPKFIKKREKGIVIYTKPFNENRKGFNQIKIYRSICSLRITRRRRRQNDIRDFDYSLFSCFS